MLSIILFAMITLSGVSLILNTGASQIVGQYKAAFGSKVTLQSSVNAEKIASSVLLSFADSSYLHSYAYTAKVAMYSSGLEALGENGETVSMPKFYLKASSKEDEAFQQKTKVIIQGKQFQQENEVIISKELAELNQLSVGSGITLQTKNKNEENRFIVTGIYEDLSLGKQQATMPLMDPLNEIYTSYTSFIQSEVFKKHGEVEGVFYLKQPSDLKAFQEEMKAKGLPSGYEAKTDVKGYEEATAPANSIHRISSMFAAGILMVGTILLLLLTSFSIRERKYEIGILRAMGMSKQHVIQTLLWETLIICGGCLLLGLITAGFLGPILGNHLLLSQNDLTLNIMTVSFRMNIQTFVLLCLIMLAAGILTSVLGILSIIRFEPRKILSERN